VYRVCKVFDIESGHMISKHPGRCRYPHGHTRRIELVLTARELNEQDMVVDFKWIRLAMEELLNRLDHAMCINSKDPYLDNLQQISRRVVIFDGVDPTTEVLTRYIFDYLDARIRDTTPTADANGGYAIGPNVRLERVRVWETPTTWAEYVRES